MNHQKSYQTNLMEQRDPKDAPLIESLLTSQFFLSSPSKKYHPKPQSFFFGFVPPLQKNKITNANTNTKDNFQMTNTKTEKITSHFFPSGADYQPDALLFIFPNV